MKKGLSILLLVIFLFNVGGYYIVFWGLSFRLDQQLSNRLDKNLYDDSETIEIKIPLSLPYPVHSDGFQRVDGRFEHNGQFFKLVKQELRNDTLIVVCIDDLGTRELARTLREYVSQTTDLAGAATNQKALNYLSKLIKDFFPQTDNAIVTHGEPFILVTGREETEIFLQADLPVHTPPPRSQA